MSAYRRLFDNPESQLFPTDFASSPARAAAAAAVQRGGGGFSPPPALHGDAPPSFQSTNQRTHTEFPPEYAPLALPTVCLCNILRMYLHQHPLRTFTSSAHSSLTQDRCYRTAPAHGVPVLQDCPLGDKFAYIRDGTGGYIVAESRVATAAPPQHHDHMFGAVQVLDNGQEQPASPSGMYAPPPFPPCVFVTSCACTRPRAACRACRPSHRVL
jgi:hypothetical protein